MVREKVPMLQRTFRLDTSAGFGKRTNMLISSATPLPIADRRPGPLPTKSLPGGLKAG
jgi:hypothetical protein